MKLIDPEGDIDLYCRLSKLKDDKLATVAVQEKHLTRDAERAGYRVRGVWVDDGISAYDPKKERPGFLGMLAAMKKGDTPNRIAAVADDRFYRQTGETAALLMVAAQKGITLVMGGREVDASDPMARAMAEIGGVMAAMESHTKSKRLREAHEEIAEQRRFHGGRRPFGYEADGLTPHPAEAPLYRELIERLGKGESPRAVADDWSAREIVGQNGLPYTSTRLRGFVFSPRLVGQYVRHGKVTGAATWEGLVTPEQQARAQAMCRSRLVARKPRSTGNYAGTLLQGMLVCANCGTSLTISRRQKGLLYYRCPSRGGVACGKILVSGHHAELEVTRRFLLRLKRPATRKAMMKAASEVPEIAGIVGQLDQVTADIGALGEMLDAREIAMSDYRPRIKKLTATRADLEAQLDAARTPVMLTADPDTLIEKWGDLTIDEQRANLAALIETITVRRHMGPNRKVFEPERISITWRF